MNSKMRTIDDINNETQARMAELTGLESKLLELHEKEWQIRTDLMHLEIQRQRLKQIEPEKETV